MPFANLEQALKNKDIEQIELALTNLVSNQPELSNEGKQKFLAALKEADLSGYMFGYYKTFANINFALIMLMINCIREKRIDFLQCLTSVIEIHLSDKLSEEPSLTQLIKKYSLNQLSQNEASVLRNKFFIILLLIIATAVLALINKEQSADSPYLKKSISYFQQYGHLCSDSNINTSIITEMNLMEAIFNLAMIASEHENYPLAESFLIYLTDELETAKFSEFLTLACTIADKTNSIKALEKFIQIIAENIRTARDSDDLSNDAQAEINIREKQLSEASTALLKNRSSTQATTSTGLETTAKRNIEEAEDSSARTRGVANKKVKREKETDASASSSTSTATTQAFLAQHTSTLQKMASPPTFPTTSAATSPPPNQPSATSEKRSQPSSP